MTDLKFLYLISAIVTALLTSGNAFSVIPQNPSRQASSRLCGWADAFKNDATLGKQENPGLKNGPKFNEQVTVNGKPVSGAVVGQKLTQVAMKARVKIPVNCQKGDCGTCTVTFNGRKVKGTRMKSMIYVGKNEYFRLLICP